MKIEKKKILIYPIGEKRHTLYNDTFDFLSKDYRILYNPQSKKINFIDKLKEIYPIYYTYHKFIRKFISRSHLSTHNIKNVNEKYDLIFSMNEIPQIYGDYIIDLEGVTALSGYNYSLLNKEYVEDRLSRDNCKAIICWNEACKESLIKVLNCKKFLHKILVIPFAIRTVKIKKDFKKTQNKVNLLFVSSVNNPQDFEKKGGILALDAYSKLSQEYPNIKFYVRSGIQKWVKKKYGHLPGLNFIENQLSNDELKRLFLDSDILLEPVPGINLILECMEYGIPIVASDYWCIPEMIINGKNGYTVDFSEIFGNKKNLNIFMKNMDANYLKLYNKKPSEKLVNSFIDKARRLIINKKLREHMSNYAQSLVKNNGPHSLSRRKKAISTLFKKFI